jgi:hypothetical protein
MDAEQSLQPDGGMDASRRLSTTAPQLSGVQFAADGSGRRSSVRAGKHIVAAALAPLDERAAAAAIAEQDWRHRYPVHWHALVAAQAMRPQLVLDSCHAGLDAAWSELRFLRGGNELRLTEAMRQPRAGELQTLTLRGEGAPAPVPWAVPYGGRQLAGDALERQLDRWEAAGICEPTYALALRELLAHPEWFDLSDRHVVLLGAASEAGPLPWLARWRARIVAVDLPRPAAWKRIVDLARAGNATLLAPRAADAPDDPGRCGADLLTQAPEIAEWLARLQQPLDVDCIAYADGEQHVRVALAMDAIAATLCASEPRTSLSFMATPTDVFAVPHALAQAVQARYESRGALARLAQAGLRIASGGRSYLPHIGAPLETAGAGRWGLVDALVVEQGPNYALAKRLQQWRALVARAAGHRVSINVAPSTTTASVVGNRLLAAGFRGAKAFGCEIFEPATTGALVAALWVHDLRTRSGKADPSVPLTHPLQLLCDGANHGGLWRVPWLPRSVLPIAALIGLVKRG